MKKTTPDPSKIEVELVKRASFCGYTVHHWLTSNGKSVDEWKFQLEPLSIYKGSHPNFVGTISECHAFLTGWEAAKESVKAELSQLYSVKVALGMKC